MQQNDKSFNLEEILNHLKKKTLVIINMLSSIGGI